MDDNAKNTSSYQLDQEILDARGINMTVEEVAGLSTCKYSERVQVLKLSDEDLAFLKGLRRRIKNRLASQNSRRRSVEHLRRLARELRAVRACRDDALAERRALVTQRDTVRDRCVRLRRYIVQVGSAFFQPPQAQQ
ncbi:segmentation protein cap'n'collar-like [Anticarsia gemmatalis]|uniref:segmentation protein cap'n'collar-like n=1 Tax=Anticarsia gemmatalis TaxID=129554 RepID=UPI003F76C8BF